MGKKKTLPVELKRSQVFAKCAYTVYIIGKGMGFVQSVLAIWENCNCNITEMWGKFSG